MISTDTTQRPGPWLNHIWLQKLYPPAIGLIVPLLIFLLWLTAAHHGWMPEQILPSPEKVWQTAQELAAQDLGSQLKISLIRLLWGLGLGIMGGIILGIAMGYSRLIEDFIAPSFHAFALIPSLAWIPLLILWLGIGDGLKVFIIFKATVIPVAIHTQTGVRDVQPQLREMAAMLRLSPRVLLWRLIIPAALPAFMIGLRNALTAAWMTLIAVELLASSEGIGYLMVWGRQLFQLDIVFVCIIIIGFVGLLLDLIFHGIDKWVVTWPRLALAAHTSSLQHNKLHRHLRAWAIPLLLLLTWWVSNHFHYLDPNILPAPHDVLQAIKIDFGNGTLPLALSWSLYRSLIGLLLGGSLGILTGLTLGLVPVLNRLFSPTLGALRQVAIFAWIPLITAWAGLEDFAKIVFVAMAAFFPLFVATWRGVDNLSSQLNEVARALRLGFWKRLWTLILPGIAPSIFAGLRLSLLYAWLGSLGAEYFMNSGIGIGSYMMGAQQHFEMAHVIAAMIWVGLLGAGLAGLGHFLENRATHWRYDGGNHHE